MKGVNVMINRIGLFAFLFLIVSPVLLAQNFFKKVSLEEQIAVSNLLIEGEVVSKKSFLDSDNVIYTINTIKVYKVFKGDSVAVVDVVTKGGTVGLDHQIVTHSLQLKVGDLGVFALVKSDVLMSKMGKVEKRNIFNAYSGLQGFYKYNLEHDYVSNLISSKKGISSGFYKEIKSFTKLDYKEVSVFNARKGVLKKQEVKESLVPASIFFTPTQVSAGTGARIEINIPNGFVGDFGNTKGKVSFRNANSGGEDSFGFPDFVDALDTQIIDWSSTSIIVEVPSLAGTGSIRVTDANNNSVDSSIDLIIDYAILNVEFEADFGNGEELYAFPTRLVNNDGSGGYVFRMETSFDENLEHPGAKEDCLAALNTWRCETGVNFSIGSPSSIDVIARDGVNVIRFDNGDELPEGTGGQTTYYYRGCGTVSGIEVFPLEIDMVFNDGASWFFGGGSIGVNDFDFQSVVLHEMGHAHQLSHVINDTGVMGYQTQRGNQLRTLSENDIEAANLIQSESETAFPDLECFEGKTSMSPYNDCVLGEGDLITSNVFKVFPNPTKGKIYIKTATVNDLKSILIFDIGGRLVFEKVFSYVLTDNSLDLSFLQKGLYFIQFVTNEGVLSKKIVLK